MDVTGQAFEDMQEQNMRLLQQLREKDDANFKLMSEVGETAREVWCDVPRGCIMGGTVAPVLPVYRVFEYGLLIMTKSGMQER